MKILVVYYSRTGVTRKLAGFIAEKLGASEEEIIDTVKRAGAVGYLMSGKDATLRRLTKLEAPKLNPLAFDLVVIGTPIWSWNISVPVRTYLTEYKDQFKQAAFFCTMGGSGDERAFREMEEIIGKKPVAILGLKTKQAVSGDFEEAAKFCQAIMDAQK